MKFFDFNVHTPLVSQNVDKMVNSELSMSPKTWLNNYNNNYKIKINNELDGANFMIFNSLFFNNEKKINILNSIGSDNLYSLTLLVDFRNKDVYNHLDEAKNKGIKCIKFHSYVQKIEKSDYNLIIKICQYSQSLGLNICIDASYGSIEMYKYNNLELVSVIAKHITNSAIIILHSGGLRAFEAMLMVLDRDNIYMETSFTLPYYKGSRLVDDLAFIYKKIPVNRILYASDSPYIDLKDSIDIQLEFFEKNNFLNKEIENIFYNNAVELLF